MASAVQTFYTEPCALLEPQVHHAMGSVVSSQEDKQVQEHVHDKNLKIWLFAFEDQTELWENHVHDTLCASKNIN